MRNLKVLRCESVLIELLLMILSLSTDIDELCRALIKLLVDHINWIVTI